MYVAKFMTENKTKKNTKCKFVCVCENQLLNKMIFSYQNKIKTRNDPKFFPQNTHFR